jgi:hypothetical protein
LWIAIAFIPFARQGGDRDLLDLLACRIPNRSRDLRATAPVVPADRATRSSLTVGFEVAEGIHHR